MDINALSVGREFRPIPTRRETMGNQVRVLFHRLRRDPQEIRLSRKVVEGVDEPWEEFEFEMLCQLTEELSGLAKGTIEQILQSRPGGSTRPLLIAAHLPNQDAVSLFGDWAEDMLIITPRDPSLPPPIH